MLRIYYPYSQTWMFHNNYIIDKNNIKIYQICNNKLELLTSSDILNHIFSIDNEINHLARHENNTFIIENETNSKTKLTEYTIFALLGIDTKNTNYYKLIWDGKLSISCEEMTPKDIPLNEYNNVLTIQLPFLQITFNINDIDTNNNIFINNNYDALLIIYL